MDRGMEIGVVRMGRRRDVENRNGLAKDRDNFSGNEWHMADEWREQGNTGHHVTYLAGTYLACNAMLTCMTGRRTTPRRRM